MFSYIFPELHRFWVIIYSQIFWCIFQTVSRFKFTWSFTYWFSSVRLVCWIFSNSRCPIHTSVFTMPEIHLILNIPIHLFPSMLWRIFCLMANYSLCTLLWLSRCFCGCVKRSANTFYLKLHNTFKTGELKSSIIPLIFLYMNTANKYSYKKKKQES